MERLPIENPISEGPVIEEPIMEGPILLGGGGERVDGPPEIYMDSGAAEENFDF